MLAKKILKNLETGNYRVEYREHCDCRFDWRLDNGELVCDIASTEEDCWFDNVLLMDDLAGQRDDTLSVGSDGISDGIIAINDPYFGLAVPLINVSRATDLHLAAQFFVNAIKVSDAYEKLTDGINSPDANNDLHDRRKREALVKWLSDTDYLRTYVYYPRDFANEYVCVLLVLPRYYPKADYLQIPAHWYPKSADKWAEMYLQKDTDGTQYDIDFQLVDQIYEIDYGNRFAPEPEPEKEPEPETTPEMVFERYSKEYGVYNWQGIELTLIQDPFLREDDFGDPYYTATAIDRKGNGWGIKWDILPHVDIDTDDDAGNHCDWENPVYAKMNEEEFYHYLII